MVLLERLSSNNFENFKTLNLERFSKENYDKNFFEYYEKEKFFLKIFLWDVGEKAVGTFGVSVNSGSFDRDLYHQLIKAK